MHLEIHNHNELFELKGSLNSRNCKRLKKYVKRLFKETRGKIILSLKSLEQLDFMAVETLVSLHLKAIEYDREFHIIGKENEKIKEYINNTKLYFIVRRKEFAMQL